MSLHSPSVCNWCYDYLMIIWLLCNNIFLLFYVSNSIEICELIDSSFILVGGCKEFLPSYIVVNSSRPGHVFKLHHMVGNDITYLNVECDIKNSICISHHSSSCADFISCEGGGAKNVYFYFVPHFIWWKGLYIGEISTPLSH